MSIHHDLGEAAAPAQAARDAAALAERAEQARLGHADFHYRADTLAAFARDEDESQLLILLHDDAEVVGFLHVFLPRSDNTHAVHVEATLDPERDPRPLLDALWPVFRDLCREEGRTACTWWESSRQDDPTLAAATGTGMVEATPVTAWLEEQGFALDQVEVASTLWLPVDLEKVQPHTDYELLTWQGNMPEHLLAGMARLRSRIVTDAPTGSREVEEARWDDARMRREEELTRQARRTVLWAVALNSAGEPVGYTKMECPEGQPEIVYQLDTFVRAEDRGHGLGRSLKTANLEQLAALRPQVRRVHTWNAGENEWMLDINRTLGFAPTSAIGAWQRTL
ncbi:hypothetical protein [Corynebacterium nasicanis]